jgi:hypothetical protein
MTKKVNGDLKGFFKSQVTILNATRKMLGGGVEPPLPEGN